MVATVLVDSVLVVASVLVDSVVVLTSELVDAVLVVEAIEASLQKIYLKVVRECIKNQMQFLSFP